MASHMELTEFIAPAPASKPATSNATTNSDQASEDESGQTVRGGDYRNPARLGRLLVEGSRIKLFQSVSKNRVERDEEIASLPADLFEAMEAGTLHPAVRHLLKERGIALPNELKVRTIQPKQKWDLIVVRFHLE